jgi:hypothetical protein
MPFTRRSGRSPGRPSARGVRVDRYRDPARHHDAQKGGKVVGARRKHDRHRFAGLEPLVLEPVGQVHDVGRQRVKADPLRPYWTYLVTFGPSSTMLSVSCWGVRVTNGGVKT